MALGGAVTNPRTGRRVSWRAAKAIDLAFNAAKKNRVGILGVIGDRSHLMKVGGHTPWRRGSEVGIVWAIDLDMPSGFLQWFINALKAGRYRGVVKFWNFKGSQYDGRGNRLKSSGDHHLHLEIADGHKNTAVDIIADYFNRGRAPAQPRPSGRPGVDLIPGVAGVPANATNQRRLDDAHWGFTTRLMRVEEQVNAIKAGDAELKALAQRVKDAL